ncbi:MAG: helix-turn-helix domain-containing protein [Flavobacteriaceae bacterium]|nr:helix-turn-helix domain-containing protein [Flavobacteriaceae bacterium]
MKSQTLGKNLKYQRSLKGLTQEELSDISNVGIRTIQRIEKEEVAPHTQTVKLLAEALKINIDDLIVLENPNEEIIEKKWLLLLHATPFLGLVIPFGSILFPLFLWIHKAKDNSIYDKHGKKIVNFHSSILLYFILSGLLFFILPGLNFFLMITIVLFAIITTIFNISSALNNTTCRYPLSIPFLKE